MVCAKIEIRLFIQQYLLPPSPPDTLPGSPRCRTSKLHGLLHEGHSPWWSDASLLGAFLFFLFRAMLLLTPYSIPADLSTKYILYCTYIPLDSLVESPMTCKKQTFHRTSILCSFCITIFIIIIIKVIIIIIIIIMIIIKLSYSQSS